jgi:hypothetical protein
MLERIHGDVRSRWAGKLELNLPILLAELFLATHTPPVDGGEITDKGYINQRAVLTRRAGAVATLEDDASTLWIGCAG